MSEEPNELNLAFADMKFGERLAKLQWMTHNRQFTPEQWVELGDTIASFYDCIKENESFRREIESIQRQLNELGQTPESARSFFYLNDCNKEALKRIKQLESQLAEAVEVLRQIDAEWCKHPSIPELKEHRQWCVDCHEWIYLHTKNPAREFLEKYKINKPST